MFGCGVAILLCCKLFLLKLGVGCHAVRAVSLGQLEHAVVECVEARERHKLELVAQLAQISLQQ